MKLYHWLWVAGCLGSTSMQAQQLRGAYYTVEKERGFSSDLLQFNGSQFFYQHSGCLGTYTGEGTFQVKGGRLVLAFHKAKADTLIRVKGFASAPTTPPTFHFRVSATGIGWLPGVTVAAESSEWQPNTGANTDTAGRASFTYQPRPNDKLVVRTVGFDPVVIALRTTDSQRFIVRMGPPYYFAAGDTLIFQLKSVRANAFAYRHYLNTLAVDDYKELPYSHCEKISAAEARRLFQTN